MVPAQTPVDWAVFGQHFCGQVADEPRGRAGLRERRVDLRMRADLLPCTDNDGVSALQPSEPRGRRLLRRVRDLARHDRCPGVHVLLRPLVPGEDPQGVWAPGKRDLGVAARPARPRRAGDGARSEPVRGAGSAHRRERTDTGRFRAPVGPRLQARARILAGSVRTSHRRRARRS